MVAPLLECSNSGMPMAFIKASESIAASPITVSLLAISGSKTRPHRGTTAISGSTTNHRQHGRKRPRCVKTITRIRSNSTSATIQLIKANPQNQTAAQRFFFIFGVTQGNPPPLVAPPFPNLTCAISSAKSIRTRIHSMFYSHRQNTQNAKRSGNYRRLIKEYLLHE